MPAFDPERFEKLLACKRAAMEYLSHCPSEELDEAERLLCVEVANCAEVFRRRGRGGNAAAREDSPHPEAPLNAAGSAPRPAARARDDEGTPHPGAATPRPADGDPLDVDYLDCPPRDGGAVYCP